MSEVRLHCRSCGKDEPLPPQKCPHCGALMEAARPKRSMHPAVVLFLLFFVLGPLALGILWRNERFTRPAKWALTVIVVIYSAAVTWYLYKTLVEINSQLDSVMNGVQF